VTSYKHREGKKFPYFIEVTGSFSRFVPDWSTEKLKSKTFVSARRFVVNIFNLRAVLGTGASFWRSKRLAFAASYSMVLPNLPIAEDYPKFIESVDHYLTCARFNDWPDPLC